MTDDCWFIYAISEGDEIVYIGRSTRPDRRSAQHGWGRFNARNVRFAVLCCARNFADASAVEAALIARHTPRFNVAFNGARRPVVRHVKTVRQGPNGPISVTMRLREGMMHPDDARDVWLNGPGTMQERLERMGWELSAAYRTFGSFGAGDAIMKKAQQRREARWAASEARYPAMHADGVRVSESQVYKALGKSGRDVGGKR